MVTISTHEYPGGHFDVAELSVCVDCIMILANGEGSSVTVDAMTATWGDDGRHLVPGGEDLGYSTSPCDGCGSGLHGDRFTAALLKPVPNVSAS